jgi:hypothetical protein
VIYEQQLEAYKSFTGLMYEIYPEKYHPYMEWDDACDQIALGFETNYKKIKDFLLIHSSILPQTLKDKVEHCWNLCSDGKFEIARDGVSQQGYKIADELWDKMIEIEKEFRTYLKIDIES